MEDCCSVRDHCHILHGTAALHVSPLPGYAYKLSRMAENEDHSACLSQQDGLKQKVVGCIVGILPGSLLSLPQPAPGFCKIWADIQSLFVVFHGPRIPSGFIQHIGQVEMGI